MNLSHTVSQPGRRVAFQNCTFPKHSLLSNYNPPPYKLKHWIPQKEKKKNNEPSKDPPPPPHTHIRLPSGLPRSSQQLQSNTGLWPAGNRARSRSMSDRLSSLFIFCHSALSQSVGVGYGFLPSGYFEGFVGSVLYVFVLCGGSMFVALFVCVWCLFSGCCAACE